MEAPPGTVPIGGGASVQAPVCAPMPTLMSSAGMVMPGSSMGYTGTTLSTGVPYPAYPAAYRPPLAAGS